ncbi:MAG: hypothetical protein JW715_16905 [Sedimentisphaerales bacterium]|nr:hypothetical protein [Sedimentisphaerales bacterium]
MGLGKFFSCLFDSELLGHEIVNAQVKAYERHKQRFPQAEPHELLACTWLSRQKARLQNVNNPNMQMVSYTETFIFACVPPSQCARALGLYTVYKERPDIIGNYPAFTEEYSRLMEHVFEAQQNGTIYDLYSKYNPRMAEKA